MATCLYQKWVLPDFTCLYLGGCQHVSQPWLCQDVSHLMSQLFADTGSLSVSQGAEALLHGDCFCGSPDHITDPACNSTVSSLLPMVLPGMSDWITNRTDWMCTDTSNGADTCSECQGQVGRSLARLKTRGHDFIPRHLAITTNYQPQSDRTVLVYEV